MPQPNLFAILVGTIIPLLTGFIYYHPKVFGKAWMMSLGITEDDLKKGNMAMIFGITLVMSFLMSWFLLYNVDGPGQEGQYDSFGHGAFHGLEFAMMIAMPVMVINGLFERKNFKYLLINVLFWTITLIIMAGSIDALNHWPDVWPELPK